jgi:hypothetical protein
LPKPENRGTSPKHSYKRCFLLGWFRQPTPDAYGKIISSPTKSAPPTGGRAPSNRKVLPLGSLTGTWSPTCPPLFLS